MLTENAITGFLGSAGVIGVPLVCVGILGVAAAFRETLIRLGRRRARKSDARRKFGAWLQNYSANHAIQFSHAVRDDPAVSVAAEALRSGFSKESIQQKAQQCSASNGDLLMNGAVVLSPMFGLLGTVLAMISMAPFFGSFSLEKTPLVMESIFEALLTTGYGLLVALFISAWRFFVVMPLKESETRDVADFLSGVAQIVKAKAAARVRKEGRSASRTE